ncbi:MAG TPA: LppP/LprE family lipoprotein [Vicinamibacterales bacterium]|nr:LppP/LprE family lipoprotein [Vicinamibacterales bacterium]
MKRTLGVAVLTMASMVGGVSAQGATAWLDRPMTSWNQPAAAVPVAQKGTEAQAALDRRCGSSTLGTFPTADPIRKAGWVPFLHQDRSIARDDVDVIGGMSAASPGCEPTVFNLFVFVGGRFAGTLSPMVMTQNRDGAAGAVRITSADALTAEFARYTATDTECCPSSRVRVTYRIDRTGVRPTIAATEARQVR